MPDSLVIVESPAKAKTIGKYLGKKYIVKASMGHVIDLPKSQLGVNIEEDFFPKYITIRGKGDILKKLKKGSGTHFDPEVVDVFLALEDEFDRIRRENLEDETELMQPLKKVLAAS